MEHLKRFINGLAGVTVIGGVAYLITPYIKVVAWGLLGILSCIVIYFVGSLIRINRW